MADGQLSALARLAQATGWKVIYSENEGQFDAAQVTADTSAVTKALGPSLVGIACGNEPDHWNVNGFRPKNWTAKDEPADAAACLAAVRAGSPKVPFVGNDAGYNEGTRFVTEYFPWAKDKAALLTGHLYPLTNCANKQHGTAETLVSAQTARTEAQRLDALVPEAAKVGLPLRMSETNSASCGGIPGVSNSDATALWAADYLMLLGEHGFVGANFHGSLTDGKCTLYTPLCRTGDRQYRAQPVYYGMLFARLMGTGRLLRCRSHSPTNSPPTPSNPQTAASAPCCSTEALRPSRSWSTRADTTPRRFPPGGSACPRSPPPAASPSPAPRWRQTAPSIPGPRSSFPAPRAPAPSPPRVRRRRPGRARRDDGLTAGTGSNRATHRRGTRDDFDWCGKVLGGYAVRRLTVSTGGLPHLVPHSRQRSLQRGELGSPLEALLHGIPAEVRTAFSGGPAPPRTARDQVNSISRVPHLSPSAPVSRSPNGLP
ncbi:hypothetical protein AB0F71_25015 [Kitasatospora sp. NPDC028055]|uniref:hypothetical protein n=1 Tax=Kitasatospora sp. NPDC028055 TaxID=3155653 RepID=UPI0033E30DB1